MTGTNNFLAFATGTGATVSTQTAYSGLAARTTGFQSGVADPAQVNKVWRQGASMAAMLGTFIASKGYDALDDGDITTLEAHFEAALGVMIAAGMSTLPGTSFIHFGADIGAVNAMVVDVTPSISAYADGHIYEVTPKYTNTTTAPTMAVDGLSAKSIVRPDGTAPLAGEIVAGAKALFAYDSTLGKIVLLGSSKPYVDATVTTAVADRALAGRMSLKEQYASGTAGPTLTSGAWNSRTLNTVEFNSISGASVASGAVTLPAGKYHISVAAYMYNLGGGRLALVDEGSGRLVLVGINMIANTNDDSTMWLDGVFTLTSTKTLRVKSYNNNGNVTLAALSQSGVPEIYMSCQIERFAS